MPDTVGEVGSLWLSLYLDDKQFRTQLDGVEKTAAQAAQNVATRWASKMGEMVKSVQSVSTAMLLIPQAITQAIGAIEMVIAAMRRFYAMAKEGAQSMRIEGIFQNVAESIGAAADNLTARLREATGRTIEDTRLQGIAMRGMLRDLNDDQLVKLATASSTMAKITGQNTAATFEQLANASELMITRQLQRMRIISRSEMSDVSKAIQMGFVGTADIVDEISRKAASMKEQMKPEEHDWADIFERMGAAWDALYDSMARTLSGIFAPLAEALTGIMDIFTSLVNVLNATVLPVFKAFASLIHNIVDAIHDLTGAVDKGLGSLLKTILPSSMTSGGTGVAGAGPGIGGVNFPSLLNLLSGGAAGAATGSHLMPAAPHVGALIGAGVGVGVQLIEPVVQMAKSWGQVQEAAEKANGTFEEMTKIMGDTKAAAQDAGLSVEDAMMQAEKEANDIQKLLQDAEVTAAKRAEETLTQKARRLNMEYENDKQHLERIKANHQAELQSLKSRNDTAIAMQQSYNQMMLSMSRMTNDSAESIQIEANVRSEELARKQRDYTLKEVGRRYSFEVEEAKLQADLKYKRQENEATKLHDQAEALAKKAEEGTAKGRPLDTAAKSALLARVAELEVQAKTAKDYLGDLKDAEIKTATDIAAARRRSAEQIARDQYEKTKKELENTNIVATEEAKWSDVQFKNSMTQSEWSIKRAQDLRTIEDKIKSVQALEAAGSIDAYRSKKAQLELQSTEVALYEKDLDVQKQALADTEAYWKKFPSIGQEGKRAITAATKAVEDANDKLHQYRASLDQTAADLKRIQVETAAVQLGPVTGMPYITASLRGYFTQVEGLKEALITAGMDEAKAQEIITKAKNEKLREVETQYYTWWADKADDAATALEARFRQMVAVQRTTAVQIAEAYAGAWESARKTIEDVFFDALEGRLKTFEDYLNAFAASVNRIWAKLASDLLSDYMKKAVLAQWGAIFEKPIMPEVPKVELPAAAAASAFGKTSTIKEEMITDAATKTADAVTDAMKQTAQQTVFTQQVQASTVSGEMFVTTMTVTNMPQLNQFAGEMGNDVPTGEEPNVVQSSGFMGSLGEMWKGIKGWLGEYIPSFHEGGIVGATSSAKKLESGLQPNEVVAVLEKGEVVIPKGGLTDFIEKYGRAAGGPVSANTGYLVGEGGRELFAPQYRTPVVSAATAHAAEEAWAAKRVAKMDTADLAQYTKERERLRELQKLEKERMARAGRVEQPEGGGLMQLAPTLLMMAALRGGGGIGTSLLAVADWLGLTSVASPTVGGAYAAQGATMGSFQMMQYGVQPIESGAAISAKEISAIKQSWDAGLSATTAEAPAAAATAESTLPSGLMSLEAERDAYSAAQLASKAATTAAAAEAPAAVAAAESMLPSGLMSLEAERDAYYAAQLASETPLSFYLGPAAAGFLAGTLSKGVKEVGDVATLGGWIGKGMSEEEQKQITKRYGGALAGAGAGAATGAAIGAAFGGVGAVPGAVIGAIAGYLSEGGNLGTILPDIWEGAKGIGQGAWNLVSDVGKTVVDVVSDIGRNVSDFISNIFCGGIISAGQRGIVGELGPELFIPHYAAGGIIGKRQLGLVGEHGPELFVPSMSGTILPNNITENILRDIKNKRDAVPAFNDAVRFTNEMKAAVPTPYEQMRTTGGPLFDRVNDAIAGMNLYSPVAPVGHTAATEYLSKLSLGPVIIGLTGEPTPRYFGGPVEAGQPYIVGESGAEAFITDGATLPRFHSGGVVGGGSVPYFSVPNQIYNVVNKVEAPPQQPVPQVIHHNANISVTAMDGADAYRVLSTNRDAIASILSEMRMDNNSRLRR